MHDRPATVAQLLSSPALAQATVAGGDEGLDVQVSDVVLRTIVDKHTPIEVGEVLVFDGLRMTEHPYQLDIAVRVCADAKAAALIVPTAPSEISLAARRLSNRFRLPLLSLVEHDPLSLTHRLRARLWATDVEHAVMVNDLLEKLNGMRMDTATEVIAFIGELSGASVGLLSKSRDLIAGHPIDIGSRRLAQAGAYNIDQSLSVALHSVPIVLAPGEPLSYWVVAESSGSDAAQRLLRTLLQIAAWYLTALLASNRVRSESDARRRIAVLHEVLDASDVLEPALVRQLRELGWNASRWNTGIYIKLQGADPARVISLRSEIRKRLIEHGLEGPLVERNDGWSGWVTDASEPPVEAYGETVQRVRKALAEFTRTHPDLVAHGGVGRPHRELDGLRRTLGESHEAAVIAATRLRAETNAAHIDQLGVQRVLMGWFSSDDFARYARAILDPVLELDPTRELLRTLEGYLDCSCSTTDAAHQLGVHRNTVANRIRKTAELLDADLDDPETRLSLQLACRVLRTNGS